MQSSGFEIMIAGGGRKRPTGCTGDVEAMLLRR
jgi:hypothetical protein